MPPLASKHIERRRDRREPMGQYVLRVDPCDGREPITCAVWDISQSGARLTLTQDVTLPPEVAILIGNVTHGARIVWRNEDQIGIEFLEINTDAESH